MPTYIVLGHFTDQGIRAVRDCLQQRLFKTGGRLIRHARYFTLQLAESYLTRPLFRQIVARIERLAWHAT
jgi:uncharacterized protein with GYD domain